MIDWLCAIFWNAVNAIDEFLRPLRDWIRDCFNHTRCYSRMEKDGLAYLGGMPWSRRW